MALKLGLEIAKILIVKYLFSLFKYLIYLVNTFYIDITSLITTVY